MTTDLIGGHLEIGKAISSLLVGSFRGGKKAGEGGSSTLFLVPLIDVVICILPLESSRILARRSLVLPSFSLRFSLYPSLLLFVFFKPSPFHVSRYTASKKKERYHLGWVGIGGIVHSFFLS